MALHSEFVNIEANSWINAKIFLVIFGINIFTSNKDIII